MKDLRNPLNRTENFEHPSGNVMKELSESDLNSFQQVPGKLVRPAVLLVH